MAKKRGNPNWGKPDMQAAPVVPTSFEEVVKKLRLSPADYEGSLQLKEWVRKNIAGRTIEKAHRRDSVTRLEGCSERSG
jgi:hypothetical protein